MATADNITFTVDGVRYRWIGGLGAVIESFERGLRVGELRFIGGETLRVFTVNRVGPFRKPRVTWTLAKVCDYTGVSAYRKTLLT